jgi:hypothetical protein
MRPLPTEVEQKATEALADAFRREGHTVSFPPRPTEDKPDKLIQLGSSLVACECTQIPPSYVYKHHNQKTRESDWNGLDLKCTIWPNEPHVWLADAISKKSPLVPDYLSRTSAKEAWLLVHSPTESNQSFIQHDEEWVLRALRHGANVNHKQNILLVIRFIASKSQRSQHSR